MTNTITKQSATVVSVTVHSPQYGIVHVNANDASMSLQFDEVAGAPEVFAWDAAELVNALDLDVCTARTVATLLGCDS
jgi:hypothetical protein